jgi:hypothetical protein
MGLINGASVVVVAQNYIKRQEYDKSGFPERAGRSCHMPATSAILGVPGKGQLRKWLM